MAQKSRDWGALGDAIREDRMRKGMRSRKALIARVSERGGSIAERTLGDIERGAERGRAAAPASVEQVASALDWPRGAVDRILDGEDRNAVLGVAEAATAAKVADSNAPARVLTALPGIYAWSRDAVDAGADRERRREFDRAAQRLVQSIPARTARDGYGLAAYRPHAEGMGIEDDDRGRIDRALDEDDNDA
jgi:hypothetical protein